MELTTTTLIQEMNIMVDGTPLISRFLPDGNVRVVFEASGMPNVEFFYDTTEDKAVELADMQPFSVIRISGSMNVKSYTVKFGKDAGQMKLYGKITVRKWEKVVG